MRLPKYRAWYKPLGVMIGPDKLESINLETKVLGVYMEMDGKGFHKLRMSDFELMQYTGMKDMKFDGHESEEICEGDIIMCPISNKYFTVEYDTWGGSWMFCELGKNVGEGYYEFEEISSFWMVCGNIYENPEILKEQTA